MGQGRAQYGICLFLTPRGGGFDVKCDKMAQEEEIVTVLVHFYQRIRPVKFRGGNKEALAQSFKTTFKDVLQTNNIVIFQVSAARCRGRF